MFLSIGRRFKKNLLLIRLFFIIFFGFLLIILTLIGDDLMLGIFFENHNKSDCY